MYTDVVANNWLLPAGTGGGYTDATGFIRDEYKEVDNLYSPSPDNPQSPLSALLIRWTNQTYRAGLATSAPLYGNCGVFVERNTVREYIDHASIQFMGRQEIHELP